jgi:hypothetical protein
LSPQIKLFASVLSYWLTHWINIDISLNVIDETTSHATKPASWQVAGYPAQAGIQ